jgi:excinuclease ABC A subunit
MRSSYRDEDVVDQIKGIAPTVAVMQKVIREKNPRSLLGTKTGMLQLLATFLSLEGYYPCPECQTPVKGGLICPECGAEGPKLEPTYFLFNSPKGMCYSCEGKGFTIDFDLKSFIPDENETLKEIWKRGYYYPRKIDHEKVEGNAQRKGNAFYNHFGVTFETKWKDLPKPLRRKFLTNNPATSKGGRFYGIEVLFYFKRRSGHITDNDPYYKDIVCPECNGARVGEFGQNTKFAGQNIKNLCSLDLISLSNLLENNKHQISTPAGKKIFQDIQIKLKNMINLGLGYLQLYRMMPTLSGGEVQRVLMMHHLENELEGLIYIFDEPTAGLHESEKQLLINKARELKNKGNTVLIVEHDQNTIRQADYLIDFGPKAGAHGGEIIYQGTPNDIIDCDNSLTGNYLTEKTKIIHRTTSELKKLNEVDDFISLRNVSSNNLKNVNIDIPLGMIVGVCGVSGSGKSSLINKTLVPSLKNHFNNRTEDDQTQPMFGTEHKMSFSGGKSLDSIAVVTQLPIGRTKVSNIATYLGVWDNIRKFFAADPEIKSQGYEVGDFSFNSKGACPQCNGNGEERLYITGMVPLRNTCRKCHGKRYNDEILTLTIRDKSISDILDMTVTEALEFFKDHKTIYRKLKVFDDTGMGYITLGQSTMTISGGEAQRLKLAKQLATRKKGHVLYIFDEPTTGLSAYDTDKLLQLIYDLYKKGNSVIIIEHDPDVLSFCDYIIELGPKGGDEGGKIIASGSPEELLNNSDSVTGKYLKIYKD